MPSPAVSWYSKPRTTLNIGALSSAIVINAEQDDGVYLDAAWISIAGFDVGNYYTWWDADLNGRS